MPTLEELISDELKREGAPTDDPLDAGGKTVGGISSVSNPDLFAEGRTPTPDQVRQRYLDRYIKGPGFDKLPDTPLRAQLVDWGINSGPFVAISALQRILGIPIDGILGPGTIAAIAKSDPRTLNNEVMKSRIAMICRLVQKVPTDAKFLGGWASRALSYLI